MIAAVSCLISITVSRQQSAQRGTLVEIVGAKLASFEKKAVEAADLVQELTIETKHAEKEVGVEIGTDGRIGADVSPPVVDPILNPRTQMPLK